MKEGVDISPGDSISFLKIWKKKLLIWIRLTNQPVIKVYHGYGNAGEMVVFGHVLGLSPLPRKKYTRNVWTNSLALIRLFIIKPIPDIQVRLNFQGHHIDNATEKDGFFRFQWSQQMPAPGWHSVQLSLLTIRKKNGEQITGEGMIYVPHSHQYAIISDIDDTFLISYSSNLRKRLFVLFTENAYSRKPFEGVVKHYQALALAGTTAEEPNPFFYVSSSEWNLYDYISDFSKQNGLPKGIYLLNQIKRFSELFKTGQTKHTTKFMRISRILELYPGQQFILLGDDSQQDPVIYASVVNHFPEQIKAVYLRNVFRKNEAIVKAAIQQMEAAGIPCCHFKHSHDAIVHSIKIGLIAKDK